MVVEDDSRLRRAFAWALERDFDVVSAGTVDEVVKHRERFRAEFDGLVCPPQAFIAQVKREGIEENAFVVRHAEVNVTESLQRFHESQTRWAIVLS